MHRLRPTTERYDDLARKIRVPKHRRGTAGISWREWIPVTKLRLRGKEKGLHHGRARQHLRCQGRGTEQTGVRSRKLAPGAKCWDCEQGSAAEFGGSGNLCNPRPVRMPSCAQIQCLSLVPSPHVSPQPCRVYSTLLVRRNW